MDKETKDFINECLRNATEEIKRPRTAEELLETDRQMAQIRLNSAAALERLENGQRDAYQKIKHIRYG
ncbi:Uncharacterised protein [uncultured archaeon]|nr:Uncharacterised protein [uncultured archaeon]